MPILPRDSATPTPLPYSVKPSQKWDGGEGSWSSFSINVGTPGQNFRVFPSTAGSETWVPVPAGCTSDDPANCAQLRGVENFGSSASPGFQANKSSTWVENGLYTVDLENTLGIGGNGLYGYDNVTLGSTTDSSKLALGNQVVAGIATKDYLLGIFGLGTRPISFSSDSHPSQSFLNTAYNQSKIPSLTYGYTAGAKYRNKGVFGSLTLGGYDSTRFTASPLSFSYSSEDSRALTVGVVSMTASNTLKGTTSFTASPATSFYAFIDSTVPDLWLPRATCDQIADAFGLLYDEDFQGYYLNSSTHTQLQGLNPSVTFKLANSQYDTTNSTNIVMPYGAFDQLLTWPVTAVNDDPVTYFPLRRGANDTQYVLGRTFLQETYLIVDNHRRNFSINQAAFPDPLPSAQLVSIYPPKANGTSSSSSSSSSLGAGAIAGIAVGGAAVLIFLALGFWFFRRRSAAKKRAELDGTAVAAATDEKKDSTLGAGHNMGELDGQQIQELYSPLHAPVPPADVKNKTQQSYAQELEAPNIVYELPAESRGSTPGNGGYTRVPTELDSADERGSHPGMLDHTRRE